MAAVHRVAREAQEAAGGAHRARPRRRHRRAQAEDRRVPEASPGAGAADPQGAEGRARSGSPTSSPASTPIRPDELQEWAGRQVHAHLLKLKAEGKVEGGSVKSAWKLAWTASTLAQVGEGVLDAAVERRVGVDHRAQRSTGTSACTARVSSPSTSPPCGPTERRADEDAASRVLDQLEEALVADLVDPAAWPTSGDPPMPTRTSMPCVACLPLGEPDRADLRVGERDPGQRAVVGRRRRPGRGCRRRRCAAWYTAMCGEGPLPGDVADRPQPVGGAEPVVDGDRAAVGVEADAGDAERRPGRPRGRWRRAAARLAAARRRRASTVDAVRRARAPTARRPRCARRCLRARTPRRSARPPRAPRARAAGRLPRRPSPSTPNRAKTWASSRPTAPPPRTTSDAGSSSASTASRLVQYSTCRARGSAGSPGACRSRARRRGGPRTCGRRPATRPGTVEAAAATHEPPALALEALDGDAVVPVSVASSRMRVRDGRPVGLDRRASPASSGTRRASASSVRGPGHHLGGDAAPVRALAADEARLDADDVEAGVGDALGDAARRPRPSRAR